MNKSKIKRSNKRITPPERPHVIAIIGTTASGKSDLALYLAKKFKGVIIAADARTIYRGLDIGTAKPTKAEQKQVPHFMIDVISPRQTFTAQKFQKAVYKIVDQQFKKKPEQPIFIVGGNGFYTDAVLKGLDFAQVKPSTKLRAKLNSLELPQLIKRLKNIDPLGYRNVDKHNKRRVVRALEVKLITGKSLYELRSTNPPDWNLLKLGLTINKRQLRTRIEIRVLKMLNKGWIGEVKKLLKKYPASSPGFSSHGYPEIINYLKGTMDREQMEQKITHNVWTYSKRQLNWFKRDQNITWLSLKARKKPELLVKRYLK